ncbi:MAG: hypothetical protein EOR04_30505 [Mesorhizobium sp.]|jgi:hypothetical protein|uniref:hypothetical protein n=1 Tax=Mesorhizobium sp. TaxID=1871066 RepID=UPI000FEA30EA|nr:hypothetical protein [Mesorhizobium sp.]RWP35714.1 MAG: hypothetical protein EOR04_30505 [Mesorhizobium sp.]
MAIDKDFVKRFKEQIGVLKNMERAVQKAIERAEGRLKQIEAGEPIERVFGPEQSPADQGGGG